MNHVHLTSEKSLKKPQHDKNNGSGGTATRSGRSESALARTSLGSLISNIVDPVPLAPKIILPLQDKCASDSIDECSGRMESENANIKENIYENTVNSCSENYGIDIVSTVAFPKQFLSSKVTRKLKARKKLPPPPAWLLRMRPKIGRLRRNRNVQHIKYSGKSPIGGQSIFETPELSETSKISDIMDASVSYPNNEQIKSDLLTSVDGISQFMNSSAFIEKTYDMIENCDPSVACWTNDGNMFVVKNPSLLEKRFIPMYFDCYTYSTFTRQLSFYGFNRKGPDHINITHSTDISSRYVTFKHEYFIRGRIDLLKNIESKLSKADGDAKSPTNSTAKVEMLNNQTLALIDKCDDVFQSLNEKLVSMNSRMNEKLDKMNKRTLESFHCCYDQHRSNKRRNITSFESVTPSAPARGALKIEDMASLQITN